VPATKTGQSAIFSRFGGWHHYPLSPFSVSVTAVPEPGTLALAAFAGLAGFGAFRRRKQQA